jgi:hypothetical protein
MERLFLFAVLVFLCFPVAAYAQGPITITGIMTDQDPITGAPVTRTITMTAVISPTYFYTGTYVTGNPFVLERSITYGDVLVGAGPLMIVLYLGYRHIRDMVRRTRVIIEKWSSS